MSKLIDIELLKKAAADVKKHFNNAQPFATFVLGSGWGDAIKMFNIKKEVPYSEISGLGNASISGHIGKLSLVEHEGKEFLVFQGRRHFYETGEWTPTIMPAFIAKELGAKIVFLSNAAGGINYEPGELMIIVDHINNMGVSPLMGEHHPELGTRFPDMSYAYNKELVKAIEKASAKIGIKIQKGTYIATSGPNYETPAEIRFFKHIGADAVGMSTVPEAIVANAMGLKVSGISCITNNAAGIADAPLSHKEVVATLNATMGKIHKLLPEIIKEFSKIIF